MDAAVENHTVSSLLHRSGRYQLRYWHFDDHGQRFALPRAPLGRASDTPDLINTAYRNADGSKTVYGIVFDLDAHRAAVQWLDDKARLDWPRIIETLTDLHPEIAHQISHAVRSSGGKGIALVLAINPLPIMASTASNQRAAQNLQSRLITLFNALGLGADPGARGLERDYPNFQNPGRLLYENRLVIRRAEQEREPIITKLHAYLNTLARQERRDNRIYPDARAETGLAKLVQWLLGCYDPGFGLWVPSYLSGSEVWASTRTLAAVTGLSSKFLVGFLKNPPAWLDVAYVRGEGWRLLIPLGRSVQRLLPRAEMLLTATTQPSAARKQLFSVGVIKEPQLVGHGERNAWLTAMALAYKWHGFSREEALAKILLRLPVMPDHESSRNCRQVRAIVKAIFKNVPETAGRFASRDLPSWMVEDHNYFAFGKRTSPRRGEAPDSGRLALVELVQGALSLPKLVENASGKDSCEKRSSWPQSAPSLTLAGCERGQQIENLPSPLQSGNAAFTAIRWRQRVGIFDGDRLVACFTKKHYRAGAAIDFLGRLPEYAGIDLRLYQG